MESRRHGPVDKSSSNALSVRRAPFAGVCEGVSTLIRMSGGRGHLRKECTRVDVRRPARCRCPRVMLEELERPVCQEGAIGRGVQRCQHARPYD